MNILLTNDDGWDAPGLAVLQTLAKQFGNIWTVAPLHPMSGISHQMTFERPMALAEKSHQTFALDGTPADCVRIATTQLEVPFDWVLSGINNGGNLGSDIYVSGTVAAAREATLRGIRAVALSQHRSRFKLPFNWTQTEWMGAMVLQTIFAGDRPWLPDSLVNVNFPDTYHHSGSSSQHNGSSSHEESHSTTARERGVFLKQIAIKECPIDRHPIPSDFRLDEEGRYLYCSKYNDRARAAGSDVETCFEGSIFVSILRLN
jgi:5'-nucleotidase